MVKSISPHLIDRANEKSQELWENPELILRLIDLIFLGNEKSIPS